MGSRALYEKSQPVEPCERGGLAKLRLDKKIYETQKKKFLFWQVLKKKKKIKLNRYSSTMMVKLYIKRIRVPGFN